MGDPIGCGVMTRGWPDEIPSQIDRARSRGLRPFGVEGHRFRLGPRLSEENLSSFEAQHGVALPSDYRRFLSVVGDGGAGPGYGLSELREATPLGGPRRLITPFPYSRDAIPDDDDPDPDDRPGTLTLSHEGCGYYHFLVVSGPARGSMWIDGNVSDHGYRALGVGFQDWYLRWLKDVLAGGSGSWWEQLSGA